MKNFFNFLKRFEIGDVVSVTGHQDYIDFKKNIGVITSTIGKNYLIKFDNRFDRHLHDGTNGMDPSSRSYWVNIKNLKHVSKIFADERERNMMDIKIKHIEIDPLSEEIWD